MEIDRWVHLHLVKILPPDSDSSPDLFLPDSDSPISNPRSKPSPRSKLST